MRTLKPGVATLLIVLSLWLGAVTTAAQERTPVEVEAHRIQQQSGGRVECHDRRTTCFVINKRANTVTSVYTRYGKVYLIISRGIR